MTPVTVQHATTEEPVSQRITDIRTSLVDVPMAIQGHNANTTPLQDPILVNHTLAITVAPVTQIMLITETTTAVVHIDIRVKTVTTILLKQLHMTHVIPILVVMVALVTQITDIRDTTAHAQADTPVETARVPPGFLRMVS